MAEKVVDVGYIAKPHGLRGDVVVALTTNRVERVARGSVLRCSGRELTVVASSPHQGRWIVHFEGVDDRNDAESLRGRTISAVPIADSSEIWIDEVAGLPVYDQNGRLLGNVEALEPNPASDLLVLDSGVLIPLVFLSREAKSPDLEHVIHVDIPEGLVESEA